MMTTLTIHKVTRVTTKTQHHEGRTLDFHTLTLEVTDDKGHVITVDLYSAEPLNIEKS